MVAVTIVSFSSFFFEPTFADDVSISPAVVTGLDDTGRRMVGGVLVRGIVGNPSIFFSASPVVEKRASTSDKATVGYATLSGGYVIYYSSLIV